ncbi:hypothetical protein JYQ62_33395 [Nostoc sp. UHCC 0702]|nr:hypothetical protein JYQ62_33395 [Nostoc sp. UHCC 0702]
MALHTMRYDLATYAHISSSFSSLLTLPIHHPIMRRLFILSGFAPIGEIDGY